jgi:hypothetical protein
MRVKAPPHSAQALLAALAEALRASRPVGRRPSTCKHVAGRPPIGRDGPGLFMGRIFAASVFHVREPMALSVRVSQVQTQSIPKFNYCNHW